MSVERRTNNIRSRPLQDTLPQRLGKYAVSTTHQAIDISRDTYRHLKRRKTEYQIAATLTALGVLTSAPFVANQMGLFDSEPNIPSVVEPVEPTVQRITEFEGQPFLTAAHTDSLPQEVYQNATLFGGLLPASGLIIHPHETMSILNSLQLTTDDVARRTGFTDLQSASSEGINTAVTLLNEAVTDLEENGITGEGTPGAPGPSYYAGMEPIAVSIGADGVLTDYTIANNGNEPIGFHFYADPTTSQLGIAAYIANDVPTEQVLATAPVTEIPYGANRAFQLPLHRSADNKPQVLEGFSTERPMTWLQGNPGETIYAPVSGILEQRGLTEEEGGGLKLTITTPTGDAFVVVFGGISKVSYDPNNPNEKHIIEVGTPIGKIHTPQSQSPDDLRQLQVGFGYLQKRPEGLIPQDLQSSAEFNDLVGHN